MTQALFALIRDTFTGKAADDQRSGKAQATTTVSPLRSLDRSELQQVSGGGDVGTASPKRGW